MKKYFSHENIVTFVLVTLACSVAILVVIPLIRPFIPAGWLGKPAATTTTTTS